MAANFHLKTIAGVLMSLCNDTHPVVHYWALRALSLVAESAGLSFSGFVTGALGMLAQSYLADTHNEEAMSLATSNLEVIFPTPVVLCQSIDAMINVLGPDLQDMTKARDLIFTLVSQFEAENNTSMLIESSRCLEHLSLYASGHMEFNLYVQRLQRDLSAGNDDLVNVAIDGLHNLMKRDAEEILRVAKPGLEDDLWLTLDRLPANDGMQKIIRNWLDQTGLSYTALWVQRLQSVLTKTRAKPEERPKRVETKETTAPELQDEEIAGFANAAGATRDDAGEDTPAGQELLKWQTRSFVMDCLSQLLAMVARELIPDQTIPAELALQQRVADIVRMAFSASTANVVELRVWGLKIVDQVLKVRSSVEALLIAQD